MTLAEIIRAQLATGRPLRVTRALLEALGPVGARQMSDAEAAAWRERDEARRNASAWADERDAMRRERDEALARLHDAHNTIGRLDRARGGDGSAASIREAEERARANEWLAQKHDAERERDEVRRTMLAMRRQRDDYADRLDAERSRADELSIALDEARAEIERLRAERDEASESLRLSVAAWDAAGMRGRDAASVIREAEERGARWALATFFGPESSALVDRSRDAARICEAARKAGEHE